MWRRRATPEAVQRLREAAARLHAQCPSGRSSVHVVIQGAEPPLEQALAVFVRLMQQSRLSCFGVVFLGSGFWASVLRSQSTAMRQRADVDLPFRQYGSIEEVAAWLPGEHLERTGVALDLRQLCVA